MSVKGKLNKEMMGPSLPLDMPYLSTSATCFKDARIHQFTYITDAKIAANVIPSQFSLDDEATGSFSVIEYGFSHAGSYREAILSVNVLYKEIPYAYTVQMMLDSTLPIIGGREAGIPKKFGCVGITRHEDTIAVFVERPKGERLATGILRLEQLITPFPEEIPVSNIVMRPTTYPDKPLRLDVMKLSSVLKPRAIYMATGSCSFTGISVVDPWHTIPVKKMLGASYMEVDLHINSGETLDTF